MAIINPSGTIAVTAAQIAAGNVLVHGPGMLRQVLVTTTLTAAQNITFVDSATGSSGTIVGIILGGSTAGSIIGPFDMVCQNGIAIQQNAALAAGAITISIG